MLLPMLCCVIGCNSGLVAPKLSDDPVFESKNDALRFVAPAGWSMRARAEIPPGGATQERLLVEYKRLSSEKPASLEVTLVDLPQTTTLAAAIKTRQHAQGEVIRQTTFEEAKVDGVPGGRVTTTERIDKELMTSEVLAVRRGPRVYFFTGFYPANDSRAKEQVHGVIDSIVWLR
jgi:hypothetical protein